MIKVLLVDDHKVLLDGLASFLESEADIQVMGLITSGKEALSVMKENQPDILITDIEMPEMDGIELTKKATDHYPDLKVLALTMYNEQAYIKDMLRAGAAGYILKNSGKEEFIQAIRMAYDKGTYFSPEILNNLVKSHKSDVASKKLSQREIEIVQLLANEMTTKQIAKKLHLSALTVKTHRKNILLKLGISNTAGLVRYAMKKGLID